MHVQHGEGELHKRSYSAATPNVDKPLITFKISALLSHAYNF